jgi:DUF438 domain-containing protein
MSEFINSSGRGGPEVPAGKNHEIPGHPFHSFKEENRALEWEISKMRGILEVIAGGAGGGERQETYHTLMRHLNRLTDVDAHYLREENLLFPCLEKHGVDAGLPAMWAEHNKVRGLLRAALKALHDGFENGMEIRTLLPALQPPADTIIALIREEEDALFPACLKSLSEDEWYDIYLQSPGIGFCLYDPPDEWKPWKEILGEKPWAGPEIRGDRVILSTGSLSAPELVSLLDALPIQVTFVDADDRVRYFSRGRDRLFTRTRAVIGRRVQQCHPPASVATVQKILDDFRSGESDSAAFWINFKGRFVHIEYCALRSGEGDYLGTVELVQDLTEKRKLEGESRLLR